MYKKCSVCKRAMSTYNLKRLTWTREDNGYMLDTVLICRECLSDRFDELDRLWLDIDQLDMNGESKNADVSTLP